ncbi:isoprenylcysteine carboxyl methyltransferase family protein [Thalassobacillus pellis]|uniref:isoprenylcysteine carboxyl methyltransferase family protein n=1 Tax=Thalassobacillus pellis TaxID=748008 RepID=UPI001961D136|nr:isoprenylcysteine carboxylmethyltransferase family protein [Thalassobacillus pellis]MBM7552517.1 methyltransferase [Thalassobacillus pellis]
MLIIWPFLLMFIVLQRILELIIAKSNKEWAMKQGGVEIGEEHYKWFILVHGAFFIMLIIESYLSFTGWTTIKTILLCIFLSFQVLRVWCLVSLGRYWNTRIIVIPGHTLVNKGPYKYLKHPNYLIVLGEFIVIPLIFQAYATAIIFPALHLLLMGIRIPAEEKALEELSANGYTPENC